MALENKEPEIHITISPGGAVEIEVFNVQGPACQALSKPYEDMFNATEVRKKNEYHQTARQSEQQRQRL